MSNFPYNRDKYENGYDANGSPITFADAERWAGTVLDWHARGGTSDWSQSNDGHDQAILYLAWGLIELLSDPNAVHRLITTGKGTQESVRTMLELAVMQNRDPSSSLPNEIWAALVRVMPQLEQMARKERRVVER